LGVLTGIERTVVAEIRNRLAFTRLRERSIPQTVDLLIAGESPSERPTGDWSGSTISDGNGRLETAWP
jgi:hypothetical protein